MFLCCVSYKKLQLTGISWKKFSGIIILQQQLQILQIVHLLNGLERVGETAAPEFVP